MKTTRALGTFTLAMISVSAILNLRGLPIMAATGDKAIFFFLLAAVLFLIPSSIVCARLAQAYPNSTGVFTWVSEAFGKKTGFLAIWMEWINNTIAFPATLAMIVATLVYAGLPNLNQHHGLLFVFMMLIFWGCTFFNFFGIRVASKLNVIGALFGTILPGVLIIVLGVYWWLSGHQFVAAHHNTFLPGWHVGGWVFFLSVLSGYSGMQITAFHAKNVKNPKKTFPRAILLAVILIVFLSIVATLSIEDVLSHTQVNLMNGVIEGFAKFFGVFHLQWLTPILAICIAIGAIASLSAWVLGPARGMLSAARAGLLPGLWKKTNQRDMPIAVLIIQGLVGTALATVFLFMPDLKSAFWMLIALTSQFTLLMYGLVFLSAFKLRHKNSKNVVGADPCIGPKGRVIASEASQSKLNRNSPITSEDNGSSLKPKQELAPTLILAVMLGLIACVVGFLLGLFPPSSMHFESIGWYVTLMLIIDGVILGVPLLILMLRKSA